jgi:hypothetical protein
MRTCFLNIWTEGKLLLMKPNKFKHIVALSGFLGISAVAFGIYKENHTIFIIGLIIVITVYLIIRKKLKDSLHNKS